MNQVIRLTNSNMDNVLHKKAGKFMSKGLLFKNQSPITKEVLWFYKIEENLWRTCTSRKIAVNDLEKIYGENKPIKVRRKENEKNTKREVEKNEKPIGRNGDKLDSQISERKKIVVKLKKKPETSEKSSKKEDDSEEKFLSNVKRYC